METPNQRGFLETIPRDLREKFSRFIQHGYGKIITVGTEEYFELTLKGSTVFFRAGAAGPQKIEDPRTQHG